MYLHRLARSLPALAVGAALIVGCGGSSHAAPPATSQSGQASPAAPGSDVRTTKIHNFAFSPRPASVDPGCVVVMNADGVAHTVTADDGHSFDSGSIDSGSSSSITVTKPGRYAYHCEIHPNMHGTLAVR